VVIRIREEHRAVLIHRNRARDAEKPLIRDYANRSESCRVRIKRVRRMRVRVRNEPYPGDVVRRRGGTKQRSPQRALGRCQGRLRQRREKERERMRTDAQGAADEQDGDEPRADHLEFCEAEGISTTGLVDEIGATKTKRRNLPKGLQRKGWQCLFRHDISQGIHVRSMSETSTKSQVRA